MFINNNVHMENTFIIERFDNEGKSGGFLYHIGEYQPNHTAFKMHWTKYKKRALRMVNVQPYISKEFTACLHLAPCEWNFKIIKL